MTAIASLVAIFIARNQNRLQAATSSLNFRMSKSSFRKRCWNNKRGS